MTSGVTVTLLLNSVETFCTVDVKFKNNIAYISTYVQRLADSQSTVCLYFSCSNNGHWRVLWCITRAVSVQWVAIATTRGLRTREQCGSLHMYLNIILCTLKLYVLSAVRRQGDEVTTPPGLLADQSFVADAVSK